MKCVVVLGFRFFNDLHSHMVIGRQKELEKVLEIVVQIALATITSKCNNFMRNNGIGIDEL